MNTCIIRRHTNLFTNSSKRDATPTLTLCFFLTRGILAFAAYNNVQYSKYHDE